MSGEGDKVGGGGRLSNAADRRGSSYVKQSHAMIPGDESVPRVWMLQGTF